MDNKDDFYSAMLSHKMALGELVGNDELFDNVPDSWHVIVTDIINSTSAVKNGMHEKVNLIATGSIVAVLNIGYGMGIMAPFFFGGDGATFIVPGSLKDIAMQALLNYQKNVRKNFQLELRAGVVPVSSIYKQGHTLRLCKYTASDIFSIPVLLGEGLQYAERVVKGKDYLAGDLEGEAIEPDLTGMQCRWDKIAPPQPRHEVVSLLIMARNGKAPSGPLCRALGSIESIYGTLPQRQPISVPKLKLSKAFARLELEIRARLGTVNILRQFGAWLKALLGYLYFRTRKGEGYLQRLVKMSDTLVIDGKINTVITGTADQREGLTTALDVLEEAGEIVYGLYVSESSVMSCYVRDLEDGHIHFVDGSEGGYTKAAGMLKQKLGLAGQSMKTE